jgi:hypothetical protein
VLLTHALSFGFLQRLRADTFGKPVVMLKLAVPAALYTLQVRW